MPLEPKPLFRAHVVEAAMVGFALPPLGVARAALGRWAARVRSGQLATLSERQLLPDFFTDIFYGLLGYVGPSGTGGYTFSREQYVEVDGQVVDAALGRFGEGAARVVAVVEGKGPKDPLERPYGGRRMSAVDQAYRYAINLHCDWLLVTNCREVRLYHKGSDQRTYERFEVTRLADDPAELRRFVFLLGAERLVPGARGSHLPTLLEDSQRSDRELTRSYYDRYAALRRELLAGLLAANPTVAPLLVLRAAQTLLDRVLFCAFSEDRGLLPPATLRAAYEHRDPYHPRPVWENFQGLFRAVDQGSRALLIPAYNGGLFAFDPAVDGLTVPDALCALFRELGEYDYGRPAASAPPEGLARPVVDVDLLGRLFERSLTDLEELQADLADGADPRGVSRRKREGAFYTPPFVTRFLVTRALQPVLAERFEGLRRRRFASAAGTARRCLEDPSVYDLEALNLPQREALAGFWDAWIDELKTVRLVDAAGGSGAFLLEAFEQFHGAYQEAVDRLEELRGQRGLFDPDTSILAHNLFAVDLNEEAIELCRLSVWIKTAKHGRPLTALDRNFRVGNSLVADPALDPKAFDWHAAFPEVFAADGFDAVVGNPPYVRQELLGPLKPYLAEEFAAYHGMADLYVYFYELGLRLLRPGGRLAYIVTNKWLKAGYGEPLRRHFGEAAWLDAIVDLGHAKQVFEDADVFPSLLVARKPDAGPAPEEVQVAVIPRDELRPEDLETQVEARSFPVPRRSLGAAPWPLEPPAVAALLEKIKAAGVPLREYAGVRPLYGVKTGFNEAFLVDTPTRDRLVAEDPGCAELLRPYLRGQDIRRWHAEWSGLWMIQLSSSENREWAWSNAGDNAELAFCDAHPSLYARMKPLEEALRKRQDQGRYWWELRSCAYYGEFARPKIFYQVIQFYPSYALDRAGLLGNDKTFCLPTAEPWLLTALNSPVLWWHNWRTLTHLKDEALSPMGYRMEALPIAVPTDEARGAAEVGAGRLVTLTAETQEAARVLLDWLRVEHGVEVPSLVLRDPWSLSSDAFVNEVRKARGRRNPLTAAGLRHLRDEHARSIAPRQPLLAEGAAVERRLADLVNSAYGLTPDDIDLLWQTAPPRMPAGREG